MAYTAETAQVRAAQLKEGLAWSQKLMKEFNNALDSYSGHLTDLKMAVSGVAQRTQVCRAHCTPDAVDSTKPTSQPVGASLEQVTWNARVETPHLLVCSPCAQLRQISSVPEMRWRRCWATWIQRDK